MNNRGNARRSQLLVGIHTIRNHDRQPAGEGLHNHRTEVFGVRGQDEQFCVHKSGQLELMAQNSGKKHPIGHSEVGGDLSDSAS